jgi:hypothetical protein
MLSVGARSPLILSTLGYALLRAALLKYGIHIAVRGLRFDNRTRIELAIVRRQRRSSLAKR